MSAPGPARTALYAIVPAVCIGRRLGTLHLHRAATCCDVLCRAVRPYRLLAYELVILYKFYFYFMRPYRLLRHRGAARVALLGHAAQRVPPGLHAAAGSGGGPAGACGRGRPHCCVVAWLAL